MNIDISYSGALFARAAANRLQRNPQELPSMVGRELEVTRNGQAYKLTISDEMYHLEQGNDIVCINAQNADPSDIFSYRPQDQWLVFSQYLHESGFFDSLSNEEVEGMEFALNSITSGLDSLTMLGAKSPRFSSSRVNKILDSYEARLELSSSSAALQYFSDKYLSEDVKQGFDELVQQYVSHNAKKVENYQSSEEKFYAARAKLNLESASLTAEQARQLSMTNKLGQTTYTKEELEELQKTYTDLFQSLKSENDLSAVLQKTRKQLLEFVTKGISQKDASYQLAQSFVGQRTDETFQRIEGYWQKLLKE
ncbi:hypothetical protein SAMN05421736_10632 [Evansella caseinilytica]|uniref:Uncharacterized protein n=1 Tax=Evansella caseinilytica TaxID=1503961 RepID=A0A1H3Q6I8_9BACI|nr:hypothetical protein [Evansella caseinilytica]SDZ08880.1 hypothetical protein SAMN05421736_10632 [Evansella caseinilytica]